MKPRRDWRLVQHPLRLCVFKGWARGRCCLISPRGTVFETRLLPNGLLMARRRREFQLVGD